MNDLMEITFYGAKKVISPVGADLNGEMLHEVWGIIGPYGNGYSYQNSWRFQMPAKNVRDAEEKARKMSLDEIHFMRKEYGRLRLQSL